jgi:hypothetical protein
MKTCTIVVCKNCQRIKRFLDWIPFDDLDQIDRDIYARMAGEQNLEVLYTLCSTCEHPSLAVGEIIY